MVFATALTAIVTFLNLRGNFSLLARLPTENRLHHVEAARLEAEQVPFTERAHRLERRPRLEASDANSGRSLIRTCCTAISTKTFPHDALTAEQIPLEMDWAHSKPFPERLQRCVGRKGWEWQQTQAR